MRVLANSQGRVAPRMSSMARPAMRMSSVRSSQSSFLARVPQLSGTPILRSEKALAKVIMAQATSGKKMNLVFVSAEVAPWSKTGGLGDVVGGLPIELAARGHKVMTIAPRYDQYKDAWDTSIVINVMGQEVRFFHTVDKGVDRVWVDHPTFLAKIWGQTGSMLYGKKSGADFSDNPVRFRLFCEAAIEACRALPFGPGEDVTFIANDWHAALVPVLLKDKYKPMGQFKDAKSAICVHNIAFQGRFWPESLAKLALPPTSIQNFEFTDGVPIVFDEIHINPQSTTVDDAAMKKLLAQGAGKKFRKANWLKAGILSCDKLLTVSPNYASEISSSPGLGVELDDVIRSKGNLEGIVNGIDTADWSPAKDKFLSFKYDKDNVAQGKAVAKAALQAELGLPVDPTAPLFGFIGRLEEQKGVDILLAALPKAAAANAQFAILGTGKKEFEAQTKAIEKALPGKAKGVVKFSAPLAHMMLAGCDFMIIPSRFEPCGLIQLHAMQYGSVPIVASTGGLVDTVKEGVTGFHMGTLDADALVAADVDAVAATIVRAAQVYTTPKYREMVSKCINQDLSWAEPAKKWEAVLQELNGQNESVKKAEVRVPVASV